MRDYDDPNRFKDALDESGVLRHGKAVRVSQFMRDAAPRQHLGDGRTFWDTTRDSLLVTDSGALHVNGNRPGWRVADSTINREARLAAYRDAERELTNAWRTSNTKFGDTQK